MKTVNMNSSEPYSIIDVITGKTIKQTNYLIRAREEVAKRIEAGENVRLVGDLHTVLEKRSAGE